MESFPTKISSLTVIYPCVLATSFLVIWKKQIAETYITISNGPIQFTQFSLSGTGLINLHHDVLYSLKQHHAEALLAITRISALQLKKLNGKWKTAPWHAANLTEMELWVLSFLTSISLVHPTSLNHHMIWPVIGPVFSKYLASTFKGDSIDNYLCLI